MNKLLKVFLGFFIFCFSNLAFSSQPSIIDVSVEFDNQSDISPSPIFAGLPFFTIYQEGGGLKPVLNIPDKPPSVGKVIFRLYQNNPAVEQIYYISEKIMMPQVICQFNLVAVSAYHATIEQIPVNPLTPYTCAISGSLDDNTAKIIFTKRG